MTTLFDKTSMTTGERVDHLRRLLKKKCQVYYISLGINQPHNGSVEFSLHGSLKSKGGENIVISKPAKDFREMLDMIIDAIEALDQRNQTPRS